MSRRGSAEEGETAQHVAGRTALDGRGRDVGDEADEDEAPQVRVAPGLEDVLAGDFASSERRGRVRRGLRARKEDGREWTHFCSRLRPLAGSSRRMLPDEER
jgi:hypothetical protein